MLQIDLFGGAETTLAKKLAVKPPQRKNDARQYWEFQKDCQEMVDKLDELHIWVLQRNLQILADPLTSYQERTDILTWVNQPRQKNLSAFSFHACLIFYDRRVDLAVMQDQVNDLNHRTLTRQQQLKG